MDFFVVLIIFVIFLVFIIIYRLAAKTADIFVGKGEEDEEQIREFMGRGEENEEEIVGMDEEKIGMDEEKIGMNEENGEEKTGGYELLENKIQKKSKIHYLKKNSLKDFIDNASSLKETRLICIVGSPYSGVSTLANMISKSFGHKIISRGDPKEQRKMFRGISGKFVIENCKPEDLDILFKGEPEDKNFVLLFVHPRDEKATGRLIRILEEKKKTLEKGSEEREKMKKFIEDYGSLDKREKYVKDSEDLLKKYGKERRVYVVRNTFV